MFRRAGIISLIGLTSFLFCGFTQPVACKNQDTSGPSIVGPAIGVGAVVAAAIIIPVVIVHEKHTLHGCLFSGSAGLELQDEATGDQNNDHLKNYALLGATADLKPGDMVKLHGTKSKRDKSAPGDQSFTVQRLSKDYGPCKVPVKMPPSAALVPAPGI